MNLESIYIIPPYLLGTCLGSNLLRDLRSRDNELGTLNVLSTKSPYYYENRKESRDLKNHFTNDPVLNEIIKDKIIYKLSIIGVLGDTPREFLEKDSDYVYRLYRMFKNKITDHSVVSDSAQNGDKEKSHQSAFTSDRLGEIDFSRLPSSSHIPESHRKYLSYTLKDLLQLSTYDGNSFGIPPSLLQFESDSFFNYPLPVSWVPFTTPSSLDVLRDKFNLVLGNIGGYSLIKLHTDEGYNLPRYDEKIPKSQFVNFIGDKSISSSTGIFYYEVEISQEIDNEPTAKPILSVNELSVSSNASPHVATGFVKRYIRGDTMNSAPNYTVVGNKLDLEKLKTELVMTQDGPIDNNINGDMDSFLTSRPGEMKGSFAINFEDSHFYSSAKVSESSQRTSLLNMNRRLSSVSRNTADDLNSGKVEIGASFKTYNNKSLNSRKTLKTDILGCGINFIDKSIFITLNGVLIKVIKNDSLSSSNSSKDNLFSERQSDQVYPIIGFKLNELKDILSSDSAQLKINTNFGFKEFQFNINNYLRNFSHENEKFIYSLDSNNNSSSDNGLESSLKNIENNPELLQKLIKGYLNQEGYLKTLKAFDSDLTNLNLQISSSSAAHPPAPLEPIHSSNRQTLSNYLAKSQFDLAIKFLEVNYKQMFRDEDTKDLIFEIRFLKYLNMLKGHVDSILKSTTNQKYAFKDMCDYGHELQLEYQNDDSKRSRINEASSLLLTNSEESLSNVPVGCKILRNYPQMLKDLNVKLNKRILKDLGLHEISNLERIFNNVESNINLLSMKYNDDKFYLLNFERDHLSL